MSNRYRYIIDSEETPKKVIVLSKYAGKDVRGIAKCSPNDKFDIETGRVLATLRCDEKVAWKRYQRAQKKVAEAREEVRIATNWLNEMEDYLTRSMTEYNDVVDKLHSFEANLD